MALEGSVSDDEDGDPGAVLDKVQGQVEGVDLGEDVQPPKQDVTVQGEEAMPGNILDALMDTNAVFDTLLAENKDSIFADFNQHETDVSGQLQFMNESTALL